MNERRTSLAWLALVVFALAALIGLGWINYRLAEQNVGGNDFQVQWIGVRALVLGSSSPYSDAVSRLIIKEIQPPGTGPFFLHFTSPLYASILILPFALLEDSLLAQALWTTTLQLAIALTILIGLRLTDWKPPWFIFIFLVLFTFFGYHGLLATLDGSLTVLIGFLLAAALLAIRAGRDELAGVLLALAMSQPRAVILAVVFIVLWALSQRRHMLVLWLVGTLAILSIICLFLVPDWIFQYVRLLLHLPEYLPPGSPAAAFRYWWPGLGVPMGWALTVVLALTLLFEWWVALRRDFRWFLWTVCLTLMIGQWIGFPVSAAGTYIILTLPFMLVFAELEEHWRAGGRWAGWALMVAAFAWEWVLFVRGVGDSQIATALSLIFPLPLLLLAGLYWVRWWAIRPRRLMMEELRESEAF